MFIVRRRHRHRRGLVLCVVVASLTPSANAVLGPAIFSGTLVAFVLFRRTMLAVVIA